MFHFSGCMRNGLLNPAIATGLTTNLTTLQDTLSNLERVCNTPLPFAYQVHLRMTLWYDLPTKILLFLNKKFFFCYRLYLFFLPVRPPFCFFLGNFLWLIINHALVPNLESFRIYHHPGHCVCRPHAHRFPRNWTTDVSNSHSSIFIFFLNMLFPVRTPSITN